MALTSKPSVFVGLFEIAGYYGNLAKGLQKLGCSVRQVSITAHPFGYETPPCGWLGELVKWWASRSLKSGGHYWPEWFPNWAQRLLGEIIIIMLALRHDVFVFSFGISFATAMGGSEMRALKLLRRKVVFIFNGSDSRAPYCDRTGYSMGGHITTAAELHSLICKKQEMLRQVHEMADVVIDYPLSAHFHTRPYADFIRLGIPTVLPMLNKEDVRAPNAPPRLLHCPSHTGIKGTNEIRRVIQRLRIRGFDLDYVELQGVPNRVVLEEIQKSDVVIDQLYSDTPMAGLAREAAQFAKPAVVGGYAWTALKSCLPPDEWPPSVLCHPDRLEECLASLLKQGRNHWKQLGTEARTFLERRWSAEACARRFLSLLKPEGQTSILADPFKQSYVWGCGMHAAETIEAAHLVFQTKGIEGFGLSEKPDLQAQTLALAKTDIINSKASDLAMPDLDSSTIALLKEMIERNATLQAQNETLREKCFTLEKKAALLEDTLTVASAKLANLEQEHAAFAVEKPALHAKVENFRGMIKRRDERIQKLESKLKIK